MTGTPLEPVFDLSRESMETLGCPFDFVGSRSGAVQDLQAVGWVDGRGGEITSRKPPLKLPALETCIGAWAPALQARGLRGPLLP